MIDYNKEYSWTKQFIDKEVHSERFKFANSLIKKGDKILDVGCNAGYLMKVIDKEVDYTGIDISEDAIKDCPHRCLVGDAETFQLDERFDKIVCLETLEHLEHPKKAIANFFNHLRKGGILIITTPKDDFIPDPSHLHTFSFESWKGICEQFTDNYSIKPIKKYESNTEKILFSVVMEK